MRNSDGRLVIGAVLIAVGLFLLFDKLFNFHFFFFEYIFSFPTILIIVGIVILLNSRKNIFGYILVIGGGYFFLKDVLHLRVNHIFVDIWPLFIIAFGLYLLLKRRSSSSTNYSVNADAGTAGSNDFETNKIDFIDVATILGSSDKTFSSQQFKGGKILTILGGSNIDLRNCKLGGERQIIDIVTLFGGTTIFLPSDWKVVISVVSIFGGFDDDRRIIVNDQIDNDKILVIKGTVLFGGGELKS